MSVATDRGRWAARLLAALLVGTLVGGCASESSDDAGGSVTEDTDDDSGQPDAPEAEATDDDEEAAPSGPDAGGDDPLGAHPCDVVGDQTVEDLTGAALGSGQAATSATVTENDLTWTPDSCTWENEVLEVKVQVAGAGDFATGQLECPEPLGIGAEVTAADDLGDSGWWKYDDDDDGEGTLRVCTATALIDVEVEPEFGNPRDEADLRAIATGIAETVLAAL